MKVSAAEYQRIRDPKVKAAIAANAGELPRLGGGAPLWVLQLPGLIYGFPVNGTSTVVRAANTEAAEVGPNLLTIDAPTMMTEWVFTSINLLLEATLHVPAGEVLAGAFTMVVQLLIGGDTVWQGGAEGESRHTTAGFGVAGPFRVAGDFNNPIPLPRGRPLQLRIGVRSSIETDQLIAAVRGNNGTGPFASSGSVGSASSLTYGVRRLTGHREL